MTADLVFAAVAVAVMAAVWLAVCWATERVASLWEQRRWEQRRRGRGGDGQALDALARVYRGGARSRPPTGKGPGRLRGPPPAPNGRTGARP